MVITRLLEILSFQEIKQDVAVLPLLKRRVSLSKNVWDSKQRINGFTREIPEYDLDF